MKINRNIYPYNLEVKKLPVYLTGMGGSEYQYHIIRMEGYQWHQILFSAKLEMTGASFSYLCLTILMRISVLIFR